jgi:carbamate kinase
MKIAVVALGGNAILRPKQKGRIKQQMRNVNQTVSNLKKISKKYRIVLTHGNGPQVGNLLIQQKRGKPLPKMPLHICGAMTQGQLGYLIQRSVKRILKKNAVTLITRVVVDKNDKAFKKPTKPIGPYYRKKIERNMTKEPEGWRKLVPSPKPKKIVEIKEIKSMIKNGYITIACGGGGIPVAGKKLEGIAAVIDKDYTTSLLAKELKAEMLIFLTDVDCVYENYGTRKQKPIKKLSVKQAKKILKKLKEGSMKPKIEASISFLKTGKKVIITKPELLDKALKEREGTVIL